MHSIHPCIPHDWFCYWMHWWTTCTSQKVKIAQPSPCITHNSSCSWMNSCGPLHGKICGSFPPYPLVSGSSVCGMREAIHFLAPLNILVSLPKHRNVSTLRTPLPAAGVRSTLNPAAGAPAPRAAVSNHQAQDSNSRLNLSLSA